MVNKDYQYCNVVLHTVLCVGVVEKGLNELCSSSRLIGRSALTDEVIRR